MARISTCRSSCLGGSWGGGSAGGLAGCRSGALRTHSCHEGLSLVTRRRLGGPADARMGALGAIAQLGERRHGMAEVVGSIPTSSTILPKVEPRSPRRPGFRRSRGRRSAFSDFWRLSWAMSGAHGGVSPTQTGTRRSDSTPARPTIFLKDEPPRHPKGRPGFWFLPTGCGDCRGRSRRSRVDHQQMLAVGAKFRNRSWIRIDGTTTIV